MTTPEEHHADRVRSVVNILLEHSTGLTTDAQFVERLMSINATDTEIEAAQQHLRAAREQAS